MKDEYYDNWFPQKRELDRRTPPRFKKREVWWCQVGVNVGYEIFGKGDKFTRPVLVLTKYSKSTFLGLPLSTSEPRIPALHSPTNAGGKKSIVRLDQARTFDARRLTVRMYRMRQEEYDALKKSFKDSL